MRLVGRQRPRPSGGASPDRRRGHPEWRLAFWMLILLGLVALVGFMLLPTSGCVREPDPSPFRAKCEARCPGGVDELATPEAPVDICLCWDFSSSTEQQDGGVLVERIERCDAVCPEGALMGYGMMSFHCRCAPP